MSEHHEQCMRELTADSGVPCSCPPGWPKRVHHGRRRPAREVLDLAADAFTEGYIAGIDDTPGPGEFPDSEQEGASREAWERSEVKRTLSEPGAEYIWRFGADGALHKQLDGTEESLGALRDAVRELLATDGGDGLYDGSRFSVAREECRRLVPRSE